MINRRNQVFEGIMDWLTPIGCHQAGDMLKILNQTISSARLPQSQGITYHI